MHISITAAASTDRHEPLSPSPYQITLDREPWNIPLGEIRPHDIAPARSGLVAQGHHITRGRLQIKALRIGAAVGAFFLFASPTLAAQAPATQKKPRALPTLAREFKGDFDGMVERRAIRGLVPYSRTLYFNDKGRARGLTADFVHDFERYINRKYQKELGKRPITVFIVPTTRENS